MENNQAIELLNALCEKFGIAIDWTAQNVMPYLQELMGKIVNYELWTSVVWLVIFTVPFLASIIFFVYYIRKIMNHNNIDDVDITFLVLLLFAAIIFFILIVPQILDIITCFTFPEKIVIDMIQSME